MAKNDSFSSYTETPTPHTEAQIVDAVNVIGRSIAELRELRTMRAVLKRIAELKPRMANDCPVCQVHYDGSGSPHRWDCPVGMAREALKGAFFDE